MKTCCMCGGQTESRLVTAQNWWGEELTLITGVPAEVCTRCGEEHFDAATTEALDRLHQSARQPERVRQVKEYAYA